MCVKKCLYIAFSIILLVLCLTTPAFAVTTYNVTINTSQISGTSGKLVFDFTSSSPGTNHVDIFNFTHNGTLGLPETEGGLVEGDLILGLNPAPHTRIHDAFFFNELTLNFTSFGTQITFTLQLPENGPGAGQLPDEFALFLLNDAGQPLVTTSDPLGANALFVICVTGTAGGLLQVFDPTTFQPPATLQILVPPLSVPPSLSVSSTSPAVCTGPGDVISATARVTNVATFAQNLSYTAALPPQILALPGTCVANVGACTVVNAATVTWTGTLAPNQIATITYQVQIGDGVSQNTQLSIDSTANVVGGTPVTARTFITTSCPAVGPGTASIANSPVSGQKAGSVLVFNLYTSSTASNTQNTRINITNIHPSKRAFVHLFFVDGATCSVADALICLTPNQTTSFLASDLDPGTTGYLVAIAVDAMGCPINFNFLVGDEYVKLSSGHAANLGAEAFAALAGGLPLCNSNSVTAQLNFDGISYTMAPRVLALDNIPDRTSGNDTLLVINRIGGNLGTGAQTLSAIFGILYDDAENAFSFSFATGACQFRSSLSNNFPRTTPRFETVIPAGRSGWMKLWGAVDIGLLGVAINFNPNAGGSSSAFNQGHNLHKLRLTSSVSLTIPIFSPGC
jgi:hypothetical protein